MDSCVDKCVAQKKKCKKTQCRKWIDYGDDLNCTVVAVKKNGSMTLQEVAKRLKYSHVRISQIEKVALRKLQKKFLGKSN